MKSWEREARRRRKEAAERSREKNLRATGCLVGLPSRYEPPAPVTPESQRARFLVGQPIQAGQTFGTVSHLNENGTMTVKLGPGAS